MMTSLGPFRYRLAPALLVGAMILAAWNWYLMPDRAASWAAALAFLAVMTVVFGFASRRVKASTHEPQGRHGTVAMGTSASSIGTAVVFTALLLVFSLGAQLATTLGAIDEPDLVRRGTMVFIGIYLVITGNALPKMLTPLSNLQCDGSRTQAFQRFAGRTWVLAGLAFSISWLALPVDTAKPLSVAFVALAIVVVLTQVVRLRWMRGREA